MIATCPACGKRYRLADDAVPPGGRNVRCAACGHGWTVAGADGIFAPSATPPLAAASTVEPTAAAVTPVAVTQATIAPSAVAPAAADSRPAPRRRRIGWLAAVFAVLAVVALAAVEFAPEATFEPSRLGLPPPRLPLADFGSLALPALPSLDLARVPLVGDALAAMLDRPASPLRITAHGERHRLAGGALVLTVAGTVANPTATPVRLTAIDATLSDTRGQVALRWRIPAPASTIGAHGSAAFETTAANVAPEATVLRLTPR